MVVGTLAGARTCSGSGVDSGQIRAWVRLGLGLGRKLGLKRSRAPMAHRQLGCGANQGQRKPGTMRLLRHHTCSSRLSRRTCSGAYSSSAGVRRSSTATWLGLGVGLRLGLGLGYLNLTLTKVDRHRVHDDVVPHDDELVVHVGAQEQPQPAPRAALAHAHALLERRLRDVAVRDGEALATCYG